MPTRTFWVKMMLVDDFCSHFMEMTPEERAKDVERSIKAIISNKEDDSFGGMMLAKANACYAIKHQINQENGRKGGRPPKSGRVRIPLPSWEAFLQFVDDNDLDYAWSRQWWEMTMNDRNGRDRDGKPIDDWQACLIAFINAKKRGVSK